jgi:hypothetical protein
LSFGRSIRTQALPFGSLAIDAINHGTCPPPNRDQCGVSEAQDGNGDGEPACDVGSYEFVFTGGAPVQAPQQPVAQEPVAPTSTEPMPPEPTSPDQVAPNSAQPDTTQPKPVPNGGGIETDSSV